MRIAVTGSSGRLGRALMAAFEEAPFAPAGAVGWSRPAFDLDAIGRASALRLIDQDRPEVVVHAAAWTDVDGCARDPELARRRNADATGILADACAARGTDLVVISTNEVFDGHRTDGLGYLPSDPPNPINPYGASKLGGEQAAGKAYEAAGGAPLEPYRPIGRPRPGMQLAILRTAWLFGPPGGDFPARILAAAERARTGGEALRLVADETGSPTYALDLADAIVELVGSGEYAGIHHVVNAGQASRAEWARQVLRLAEIEVETEDVPASTWTRASTPPAWAALAPTALPGGAALRPWQAALADYMPSLLRGRAGAAAR